MSNLSPSAGPLVLVVEDDPDHRDLLAWACTTAGADPLPVPDPAGADVVLAGPLGAHISLFVLDRRLPGRDGLALCRELRADARHAQTPVLVVSASAGPAASAEALDAGANAYVTKPFSLAAIRAQITDLLATQAVAPAAAAAADWTAQFARYAALAGATAGAVRQARERELSAPLNIPLRRGA